ncbi:MAG: hypothetical protein EBU90_11040 [Proteobacteria bacterium]|nr:hypothetical protein [Pseudomonadota bacterium]NBP14442.1 hypothetical protein [bacterium]
MAHFAQLDMDNNVIQVIVVANSDILDEYGNEDEQLGIALCKKLLGEHTNWVQTSHSGRFRKNYAGVGFRYDPEADAFIPPKLFNSWILDTNTYRWKPPVDIPEDAITDARGPLNPNGKLYYWNEELVNWVEDVIPTVNFNYD